MIIIGFVLNLFVGIWNFTVGNYFISMLNLFVAGMLLTAIIVDIQDRN